jgi:hypothetical protein
MGPSVSEIDKGTPALLQFLVEWPTNVAPLEGTILAKSARPSSWREGVSGVLRYALYLTPATPQRNAMMVAAPAKTMASAVP